MERGSFQVERRSLRRIRSFFRRLRCGLKIPAEELRRQRSTAFSAGTSFFNHDGCGISFPIAGDEADEPGGEAAVAARTDFRGTGFPVKVESGQSGFPA